MRFEIEDGLLLINGRPVKFVQATAWGKDKIKPTAIVLHDTAAIKPGSSVSWFDNPSCKSASAHFVIERDGTVVQMVRLPYRAFHAGQSKFPAALGKKQTGNSVNPFTFGIEIMNPGMMERVGDRVKLIYHDQGGKVVGDFPVSECREVNTKEHGRGWCQPYTEAQVERVIGICRALVEEYPTIKPDGILTHWIVSPRRKVDTNPLFPLERVREAVFAPEAEPQPVAPPPPVAAVFPGPQPQAQTQTVAWAEPAMKLGGNLAGKIVAGGAVGSAVATKAAENASGPEIPTVDPAPAFDQLKTATERANDGVAFAEAMEKIIGLFHDNPWIWPLLAGGLIYVAWKFLRPFIGRISIAPKPDALRDPAAV